MSTEKLSLNFSSVFSQQNSYVEKEDIVIKENMKLLWPLNGRNMITLELTLEKQNINFIFVHVVPIKLTAPRSIVTENGVHPFILRLLND
jgi:hypothetical protein